MNNHPWGYRQHKTLANITSHKKRCTCCGEKKRLTAFPNRKTPCFSCRDRLKQESYVHSVAV